MEELIRSAINAYLATQEDEDWEVLTSATLIITAESPGFWNWIIPSWFGTDCGYAHTFNGHLVVAGYDPDYYMDHDAPAHYNQLFTV